MIVSALSLSRATHPVDVPLGATNERPLPYCSAACGTQPDGTQRASCTLTGSRAREATR